METIIPRLHASAPELLGFGPSLEIRAFLLQRERGNCSSTEQPPLNRM